MTPPHNSVKLKSDFVKIDGRLRSTGGFAFNCLVLFFLDLGPGVLEGHRAVKDEIVF